LLDLINKALLSETVASLRSNQLDVVAYCEKICDRIGAVEPRIQALIPESNRRERLAEEAVALKTRFPDPTKRPPLYGVLVGVKDIFHVDGFPTRAGSKLPAGLFDGPEATCVTALRAAGALILGKTVTTEFAYFEPGPTRNPHNLDHTPGGSSSGSAAAVAAGFCPLALGTQTIGSVIRPAAFCGVIGFKPSYGRISTEGLIYLSKSLDHVGLFTQDVAGMKLAASILYTDWQTQDSTQLASLPVLGVLEGPYLNQASPGVLNIFETQLAHLGEAGYTVRRVKAFDDLASIIRRHRVMCSAEAAVVHVKWFARYEKLYRPKTAELIREGFQANAEELAEARDGREALRSELEALMSETGVELWISPATVSLAPKSISNTGDPAMNLIWTHAGLPALTLPGGFSGNGLPLGLQFVTAFKKDERLLTWAESLVERTHRL